MIDDATGETLLGSEESGSSLLEIGSSGYEYAEGLVEFDGKNVSIDVSSLPANLPARVRFQLLDFDPSHVGDVVISGIGVNVDATQAATSYDELPKLAFDPGGSVNSSSYAASPGVQLLVGNERFDLASGQYKSEIRLQNIGTPLGREFVAVFDSLPSGVTILNPSGLDGNGHPYLNFTPAISSGGLITGGLSSRIRLEIDNPSNIPFSLAPEILSGGPNTAPSISAINPLSAVPGEYLSLAIPFSDTEGDDVELTINGPADLPTMMIDGMGNLVVTPEPGQEGSYTFNLVAFDGALSTSQSIQLTVAADVVTTTRLSGTILNTDGSPLASVPIELGVLQTITAADGTFMLETTGALPGDTLIVHGEALTGSAVYPYIAEKLPLVLHRDVFEGARNDIGRPIYLPALDVDGGSVINAGGDTMVVQEIAPGEMAEVFVAQGTLEDGTGNTFSGTLSITEVPAELTPASLPPGLFPDTVVTIQPGDMVFTQPAPLTLPNRAGWPIGTELDLYSINPVTGEFEIVGKGRVSTDGEHVETIEGGINNSSWHFTAPPVDSGPNFSGPTDPPPCGQCKASAPGTSEIILLSGELVEEHELVSYQSQDSVRGLTLSYRSLRADPRPILRFGFQNIEGSNRMFARAVLQRGATQVTVPGYQSELLNFPDIDSVNVPRNGHFWDIDQQDAQGALQFDLRDQPSGSYGYILDTGIGQGQVQFSSSGDGGELISQFSFSGSTNRSIGEITIINGINSPFGAGWDLVGLQQLIENPDGSLVRVDGDGLVRIYEFDGTGYLSPDSDFSVVEKLGDGTYRRTLPDQTIFTFNTAGQLASISDATGNLTQYIYDSIGGKLTSLVDPAGLVTTFGYLGSRITSITDPASRITQLEYDSKGNLTRLTDPDGSTRTFEYDDEHHMTAEIDERGSREEANYGFHGRIESVLRKDGTVLTYSTPETQGLLPPELTRNPVNSPDGEAYRETEVATYTDQNGVTQRIFLDSEGRTISTVDDIQSGDTVVRNEDGFGVKSTSPRGRITEFTYDDRGNVTTILESGNVPDTSIFSGNSVALESEAASTDSADFNNDGFIDLVVARPAEGEIDVFLGSPTGGYGAAITTSTTSPHGFVLATDVDGDNRVDLVTTDGLFGKVAPQANARISVFKGLGNGLFETRTDFLRGPTANDPSATTYNVVAGDFNNDGRTDLFALHRLGETTVYLNEGLDGFSFLPGPDVNDTDGRNILAVGDVNEDGNLDVRAHGDANSSVRLFGNGDGTFATPVVSFTAATLVDLKLLDIDGDGHLDVVQSFDQGCCTTGVLVGFGLGDGQFEDGTILNTPGQNPSDVASLDVNNDGLKDLVLLEKGTLNNPDTRLRVFYATSARAFGGVNSPDHAIIDVPDDTRGFTVSDLDGDGREDLVVRVASGELQIYRNSGDGTFKTGTATQPLTNN